MLLFIEWPSYPTLPLPSNMGLKPCKGCSGNCSCARHLQHPPRWMQTSKERVKLGPAFRCQGRFVQM